jgi:hypothetical protein
MSDRTAISPRPIPRLLSRVSYAGVAATLALFFALGGTTYAFIVNGALVADESLTGADVLNDSLTAADIRESTLPKPLWAIVNADGTVRDAGQPGTTVQKFNVGGYAVRFGRDVSGCAATATTVGQAGGPVFFPLGTIKVIPPEGGDNWGVVTLDAAGGQADRPFSIIVAC